MYTTQVNESSVDFPLQNASGKEPLFDLMYEENRVLLQPQVHIVNNPLPSTSNKTKTSECFVSNRSAN